jgi:CRISPR-associated protein (TIGR03984 family)
MSDARWTPVQPGAEFLKDAWGWLAEQMTEGMPWLLVHADDGVIWGKQNQDGKVILSSDVFDLQPQYPAIAVELRSLTIQQARMFGKAGELLVWRTEDGFAGRLIEDGEQTPPDAYEEEHLLWGVVAEPRPEAGFTLLAEGDQGQQHAVPLVLTNPERACLRVRHYVRYDDHGQAYVDLSRLVDLRKRRVA